MLVVMAASVGAANAYDLVIGSAPTLTLNGGVYTTGQAFNFSLDPDAHLWDPGYTGPKDAYTWVDYSQNPAKTIKPHKFQSSVNQFMFQLSVDGNVTAWDRDNNVSAPVSVKWAISSPSWNSPLFGNEIQNFQLLEDGTISAKLISDGNFHWASSANDYALSLEGWGSEFMLTGNINSGINVTALDMVPEPGSFMFLAMGLGSVAGMLKLRRK